jgi:tetratricopeptide (TPR) repeat protein
MTKPRRRRQQNRRDPSPRLRDSRPEGHAIPQIRWWMRPWLISAFLVLLTATVYSPVRRLPFIDYDDPGYVVQNSHVQNGLTWNTFVWSLTATEQTNWHPLTWLSHALDCQLFGLNPAGHHLTNLIIHVINVLLLFWLFQKATGATGPSFLVAALFTVHPFNVDSVAWVAERKNVLSTLFFLLTLGAYGWYTRKPQWQRYTLVAVLFVGGLAAKPMLVTLPFALLLLDYWPLQRITAWTHPSEQFPIPQASMKRLLMEKLPLLALSAASSVVTIIAQHEAIKPLHAISFGDRLQNALASYALYIWKACWPSGFAIYYPHLFDPTLASSPGAAAWAAVFAGVLLLTVGSAIVWSQRRTRPYLLTGWAWYLGTLVPVIGIVQVGMQAMADRYAYLPLIGVFIIVAWGTAELANHFRVRPAWREISVVAVLAVLSLLTVRQLRYWRTDYALWSRALQVTANNYYANDQVGSMLASEHRPEALHYFEEAARIAPLDPTSHEAVAAHLQDQGLLKDAIRNYEVVVHRSDDPHHLVFAYTNLCVIFGELGDYGRAREAFARAVRQDPQLTGMVIRELAQAVTAHPADEGYLRLGLLFEQGGELADARYSYEQALKLNPNRAEAQKALSHLEGAAGNSPGLTKSY